MNKERLEVKYKRLWSKQKQTGSTDWKGLLEAEEELIEDVNDDEEKVVEVTATRNYILFGWPSQEAFHDVGADMPAWPHLNNITCNRRLSECYALSSWHSSERGSFLKYEA